MTDKNRVPGLRHRLADRLFHWIMAAVVIVLGATAFLPMVGVRFDWLPIHWIAGVVLTLTVLFHIVRVFGVLGLRAMVPGPDDLREIWREARGRSHKGLSAAKYDAFQKGMHLGVSLAVIVIIGTGLVMLARIDTNFWNRNPALMSELTWGWVYVAHGLAAVVLLFLVILHVYFAVLPEHRKYLSAMLFGRGPELARKPDE